MITDVWAPPQGSTELEPGWWQAPNGSIYSHPDEDVRLEALRAQAAERYSRHQRWAAARIPPEVIAQFHLEGLEARACQAYAELAEAQEQEAFLEDLLAAVMSERA